MKTKSKTFSNKMNEKFDQSFLFGYFVSGIRECDVLEIYSRIECVYKCILQ